MILFILDFYMYIRCEAIKRDRMKKIHFALLFLFTLSACGGQTIIINEAPSPVSHEQKLQSKNVVRQLQVVVDRDLSCDKKGYKLVNEELSGNSKICYYLVNVRG